MIKVPACNYEGKHFAQRMKQASYALLYRQEEKKANISRIAENRSRQEKLLRDALVYRSQTLKQSLAAKGVVDDKLTEEVSVTLLTDLQQKQNAENNAMTKILAEKVQ